MAGGRTAACAADSTPGRANLKPRRGGGRHQGVGVSMSGCPLPAAGGWRLGGLCWRCSGTLIGGAMRRANPVVARPRRLGGHVRMAPALSERDHPPTTGLSLARHSRGRLCRILRPSVRLARPFEKKKTKKNCSTVTSTPLPVPSSFPFPVGGPTPEGIFLLGRPGQLGQFAAGPALSRRRGLAKEGAVCVCVCARPFSRSSCLAFLFGAPMPRWRLLVQPPSCLLAACCGPPPSPSFRLDEPHFLFRAQAQATPSGAPCESENEFRLSRPVVFGARR